MRITSIEIKGCVFVEEVGQYQATLLIESNENRLCLSASTRADPGLTKDVVFDALIADGLRQIKRMPEYRGTGREITLAPGARRA